MEEMLQYARGELCSEQSATSGLFTESGKNSSYAITMIFLVDVLFLLPLSDSHKCLFL